MNQKTKTTLSVLAKGLLLFALMIIVFLAGMFFYFRQNPVDYSGFEPIATVNYTYAVPASATILEGDADIADRFGDHSLCLAFQLPEAELEELRQQRMNWFSKNPEYASLENWTIGMLTPEQLNAVSSRLQTRPDPDVEYSYIEEEIDQLWRAAAINENTKIIYYCRASW